MKWSRYNKLFESKRNGWLLYNSASSNFLMVEDDKVESVKQMEKDLGSFDFSQNPMLYMQLRSMGFIVEDSQDDDFYNITKMNALTRLYSNSSLSLTIAITRACNFDCSYCFEGNRTGKPMSEEVEKKLIDFISHYKCDQMSIIWYGGEPLLAFDRILSIDSAIKKMGKKYSASMITNGYLFNDEKISKLNELNITYLQITLDGKKETHDGRRYLKGGGPTYDRILENIGKILKTDFKGKIHVRVNVDSRNEDEFPIVYNMIRQMFPNDFPRRISVYPGFVKGDDHPDVSCFFEPDEQGAFISKMMEKYGINPLAIYPRKYSEGCVMNKKNGFVVGPDGELYKCWDDIGDESMVVGHIDSFNNWNMPLLAECMVGCSYLDDPECRACYYLPVCNGGCHRIRQKNLHSEVKHSSCTYFKGNLEDLLELHFEEKKRKSRGQKAGNAPAKTNG
ncbi:MAG: radical SAM protein [Lachnospiraceae bacterium]|nr:radical SAM protein [Lachnospiraceae bacterium]